MRVCRWVMAGVVAFAALGVSDEARGQEVAFKAGFAISSLSGDNEYWDEGLTTTMFGGHIRFGLGPFTLQPELYVVTKGASTSSAAEEEQLRLEYIEIPVLLVVPLRLGAAEPYAFGGPSLSLESRCRWVFREQGLKTDMGCVPTPHPEVVTTRAIDFGVIGGAGLAYPLGPGRILLEARYNHGLRNIVDGPRELRNRTALVMIGYTMNWAGD
jgi:hypothetical protein